MLDLPRSYTRFLIFPILSTLFMFSMFYRVSNAVISPNLIRDLGLNAETLGILGGAFFYSFALIQIPMGPMLDRIGPRFVVTFFPFIGALGAFIFAISSSYVNAIIGRILIGAGMGSVLMGSLKVFALRFSPKKFATLTGTLLSIGTIGSIFAATPLAYLSSLIGWRKTFMLASGMTAVLAGLVCWVLREGKKENGGHVSLPPYPEIGYLQSIQLILSSLAFWEIATISFVRYGTFVSLQGLWLGPYLINIKGYSPIQTGNMLILISIGWIIGGPLSGQLSDRVFHSRKGVVLWGMILYCFSLFPLTGFLEIENSLWYFCSFFFMGFFNVFGSVALSHAKELFPIAISGTVLTMVNLFSIGGAAVFMPVFGRFIESFLKTNQGYPAEAYHLSFLICFLSMVVSVIFYAFSKKTK